MKLCSVDRCGRKHYGLGYCERHYKRLRVHGDPLGGRTSRGAVPDFFERDVLSFEGEECLEWPFTRSGSGYGQMRSGGQMRDVHRLVCEITHGQRPKSGVEAAHSCGNKLCVNPTHISWKTPTENAQDKEAHGTAPKGEANGGAKLKRSDADAIRMDETSTLAQLSQRFGVSQSQISRIRSGHRWA